MAREERRKGKSCTGPSPAEGAMRRVGSTVSTCKACSTGSSPAEGAVSSCRSGLSRVEEGVVTYNTKSTPVGSTRTNMTPAKGTRNTKPNLTPSGGTGYISICSTSMRPVEGAVNKRLQPATSWTPEKGNGRHRQAQLTLIFVRQSKLHGLKYIYSPKLAFHHRAFWFLALCTSLGFLLAWSSNRLLYWLSFPSHTTMHLEWSRELAFPAVTLCNNNPVRFYRLSKSDLYHAGQWLGLLLANRTARPLLLDLLSEDRRKWFRKLADFRLFLPPRSFDGISWDFMDRLGHQLEDMLLSCKYRGEQCGPHNFSAVFTRYGKCYMFNSGQDGHPLLTTVKGGTGNGLEIMLDIQQDEYLPIWGDKEETTFEAGVKVQIHSQSEPPFVQELGFGVAPGFQTFVATQEQRLIYLPPPWGECRAAEMGSDFFPVYSITACRIDCETRYIVENCNCRMVHMPGDAPFCTPEQYKECAEPALGLLAEKDSNYCICRMPCNLTRYSKELSMVKIPSKTSAKYLEKRFNKSEKYISENVLILDVYFEALNYETIEQKKAYEVAGLLGDIGGHMGLFIGASILTILELFDYMYELIKEKLLDLLGKENDEESHNENLGPCNTVPNHAEATDHTVNVPLHSALGTVEEITC
ncbi:LOW QUALITY PROTEIN: acid-sensing ion channel 2-like [Microcaecilia unicolor]|uniref:LOW QUALITY PROTEIN: acid-sensing ion channel 2-like n=1 Tax=Microcaecilia unicolor TaxID=1415580 RepID=A0A6P7ZD88_9AMPH|nr:LOW QUALITY PROTEIN: acid-sensing ion channel 2-like [Microcaecilia unicolor]